MPRRLILCLSIFLVASPGVPAFAQAPAEDEVVINEFAVNSGASGKEYVELLVTRPGGADLQSLTLSDVGTRAGATGSTEGDIRLPASAGYLAAVPQGTHVVLVASTPSTVTGGSTPAEDLSASGDRRIVITPTTSGVLTAGTFDVATNENFQLYAGTRADGPLVDQVLMGNSTSLVPGATWGDGSTATTTDNVNGGAGSTSETSWRFVPTSDSLVEFQSNDTGAKFLQTAGYGTPGATNQGVSDTSLQAPAPGTLQFSSATYTVGEAGPSATVTVTRTGGSAGTVSVDYATADGSAGSADYTAANGTLTFGDGETEKTFTVAVTQDPTDEPDETVGLTLGNPTGGASLGGADDATLTITDDDTPPAGTFQFSSATYSAGEGAGSATITVTRTGGSFGTASVQHAAANGTAADGDYAGGDGALSWADGEDGAKTFSVTITQDAADESDETVLLSLASPTGGATLGTTDDATLTIADDDVTNRVGVLLSEVRLQGPDTASSTNGRDDEYVELRNTSASEVDLGGWKLQACNGSGGTFPLITFANGTKLPAGATYVAAHGGASAATKALADVLWSSSNFISSTGGVRIVDASEAFVDGVGHTSGTNNLCREPASGGGVPFPADTDNTGPFAFERKQGGTQDTNVNADDFEGPKEGSPQKCGDPCAPPPVEPTITRISAIQGSGQSTSMSGDDVVVEGVVTGIDAEVGANFQRTFPEDAGIYVQEEQTADPATDDDADPATSEGIFVGFVDTPSASLVGKRVRIAGRVKEKFNQTIISEVGSSDADVTEPTVLGDGPAVAPTAVTEAQADAQAASTKPYYESLENMLVTVATATANSGGTNKFGELFLTLGTEQNRVFRTESPPDLLAAADDAGFGNQPNPYTASRSSTFVAADLFDRVSGLTGPLGFSFGHFKLVNQSQPTVTRGPTPYPSTVPEAGKRDVRVLSFNVENVFPVGGDVDLHTVTPAEYEAKLDGIVLAIGDRLRRPDVVALQEIVDQSVADDLADELGGYTAYLAEGNDERGIDVAYLIKDTIRSVSVQQLGKDAPAPGALGTDCADASNPKLFDRPPLRADVDAGGGLRFTVINNHFASKGNPDGCRDAQGSYVRDRVAELEAEGREVIVTGDLNSFEDEIALQRLQDDSTTLDNLWDTAPAEERYSFQFDGKLQTLDHMLVTDGLLPRVGDFRYAHIDNDYFKRIAPQDGHGVSDHDPVLLTLQRDAEDEPGKDKDKDKDKDKENDKKGGGVSSPGAAPGGPSGSASSAGPPLPPRAAPRSAGFRGRGVNVTLSSLRRSGRTLLVSVRNRNAFAVRGTLRAETVGRRRARTAVTLGRATVRLAPGASRRVRLRLSRPALRRLRRTGRIRIVLTLTDPAGARRTVRLTPAVVGA